MAVRRGRGAPLSGARGVARGGAGVKTAVGETCGCAGSNGAGVTIAPSDGNVTFSVLVGESKLTLPPSAFTSGANST